MGMDVNKDGQVTQAEYIEYWEKLALGWKTADGTLGAEQSNTMVLVALGSLADMIRCHEKLARLPMPIVDDVKTPVQNC